jgi:uncharacterized protein YrrD
MKSTNEIVGLVLLCINEGKEAGTIKDILINRETGAVEFLVLDDGQWYFGAKVLSFTDVLGIGSNAVTTETEGNILRFTEVERAVALAQEGVKLIGTKIYTEKGRYIGKVDEFFISEDGGIAGCKFTLDDGQVKIIPRDSVLTFGKNVIVVVDRIEEKFVDKMDNVISYTEATKPTEQKGSMSHESPKNGAKKAIASILLTDPVADIKDDLTDKEEAARSFEQKQRQFLIGRKVSKRISSKNGEILAEKGTIITDELIDRIKESGKYMELTMNTSP